MEDPRIISALFIFLKMAYYNVLINNLQEEELKRHDLVHFDDWANMFGEVTTTLELAPEGYTLIGQKN